MRPARSRLILKAMRSDTDTSTLLNASRLTTSDRCSLLPGSEQSTKATAGPIQADPRPHPVYGFLTTAPNAPSSRSP
jgi:hypothetical protein